MTSTNRRHFGVNSRSGCCVMESLAETEAETEADGELLPAASSEKPGSSQSSTLTRSAIKSSLSSGCQRSGASRLEAMGAEDHVQPPGCTAPFFGVKHYLHNFYGLPHSDDPGASKAWQQIHSTDIDDDFDLSPIRSARKRQRCTRWSRLCFGYTICLGVLMALLGITCLLLGYLLPRHQVITGQIEEQDLKMWIANHRSSSIISSHQGSAGDSHQQLTIVDNDALEYNNLLDLMKIGGLVGVCFGCLVIVMALIFPNCQEHGSVSNHSLRWQDDDEAEFNLRGDDFGDEQSTKLSQALRNCLRSFHLKTHSTVFYSGLVASNNDKIPVYEQLKSIQPPK